jgi:hypothetical protein
MHHNFVQLIKQNESARLFGRDKSTKSRELARNTGNGVISQQQALPADTKAPDHKIRQVYWQFMDALLRSG